MDFYNDYPPQSPYSTGLAGRCPRCGEGKLFNGFITTAEKCGHCGLDYKFIDSGDGPAVFVTLIGGFVLLGMALFVQMTWNPPVWLLMLIFFPLTLIVSVGMLRPLKGLLIALQFANKAEQGRLKK
ncbi:MAG: DUF983 domain-containing protein [Beijerinckiaceae bacterium]